MYSAVAILRGEDVAAAASDFPNATLALAMDAKYRL